MSASAPRLIEPTATDPGALQAQFARDGFLIFASRLPPAFHRAVHAQLMDANRAGRFDVLGNNLLAGVPDLTRLLDDEAVIAATHAVLGPDPLLHPHRAAHLNPADAPRNPWHRETHGGFDYKARNHRPFWGTLFYYPQETDRSLGPTALLPGSHCLDQFPSAAVAHQAEAIGAAGTCVLLHYDLWHRRQPGVGHPPRLLVKFEFARSSSPAATTATDPTVHPVGVAVPPSGPGPSVGASHRCWLAGATTSLPRAERDRGPQVAGLDHPQPMARIDAVESFAGKHLTSRDLLVLGHAVHDEDERVGLTAAYVLAGTATAQEQLSAMVATAPIHVARRAASALAACLDDPAMVEQAASSPHDLVRQLAAWSMAEAGTRIEPTFLPPLEPLLRDPSPRVRLAAIEAAGTTKLGVHLLGGLRRALEDPSTELKVHALVALARLGGAASAVLPHVERCRDDGDRYVEGFAIEAHRHLVGGDSAQRSADRTRWCRHTTPTSPW